MWQKEGGCWKMTGFLRNYSGTGPDVVSLLDNRAELLALWRQLLIWQMLFFSWYQINKEHQMGVCSQLTGLAKHPPWLLCGPCDSSVVWQDLVCRDLDHLDIPQNTVLIYYIIDMMSSTAPQCLDETHVCQRVGERLQEQSKACYLSEVSRGPVVWEMVAFPLQTEREIVCFVPTYLWERATVFSTSWFLR